jgi:hypothetical protein
MDVHTRSGCSAPVAREERGAREERSPGNGDASRAAGELEARPEPDVWWGEDGIDALTWADPIPYVVPTPTPKHLSLAADDGGES